MTIDTKLLDFTTSDNETLHGLLFSPRDRKSDLALLFVHGVAMNFYLPPLPTFASASHKIVPGSDHFYHGYETEVIGILSDWLKQFKI